MKILINFLTAFFLGGWIITMSVFSIQNINPVSLRFLGFESIKLPVGVLLSFGVGLGLILGSLAPLLLPKSKKRSRLSGEDLEEFNF
jgi:uncharacterized integral membrane protein